MPFHATFGVTSLFQMATLVLPTILYPLTLIIIHETLLCLLETLLTLGLPTVWFTALPTVEMR